MEVSGDLKGTNLLLSGFASVGGALTVSGNTKTASLEVDAGPIYLNGRGDYIEVDGKVFKVNGNALPTTDTDNLEALTDTNISTAKLGQALVYNGSKWINDDTTYVKGPLPAIPGELNDLSDVDTSGGETAKNVLIYDGVGSKYKPGFVDYADVTNTPKDISITSIDESN